MKNTAFPVLPSRGRSASGNGGPKLPCLCGCGELTGSRFRPGHDGRLNGWVNHVVSGGNIPDHAALALAIRTEIALRKAAGITDHAHAKLQITRQDLEKGGKLVKATKKVAKARKPRAAKPVIEVPAATDQIGA